MRKCKQNVQHNARNATGAQRISKGKYSNSSKTGRRTCSIIFRKARDARESEGSQNCSIPGCSYEAGRDFMSEMTFEVDLKRMNEIMKCL